MRSSSPYLFYAECPNCRHPIGAPFNRLGGPQYKEHSCGQRFSPKRVRFLVAASGMSYLAYCFDQGEAVEPVFESWVRYWHESLCVTVGVEPNRGNLVA